MITFLNEHKPHFGTAYFVRRSEMSPGDVITFTYKKKTRYVFVLDPDYEGKLHGLTLDLTPRDALINEVVDAMYDTDIPKILYDRAVYQIASKWDSYRTYFVSEMAYVRRLPYYIKAKK